MSGVVEGIGLAASLLTICELGIRTIKFIREIRNASHEQLAIVDDLNTLVGVLGNLRHEVNLLEQQRADPQLLARLRLQLEPLLNKLRGRLEEVSSQVDTPKSIRKKLEWIGKKEQCKEFRAQLGIVLGAIQIILEENNLSLMAAAKREVDLISSIINETRDVVIDDYQDRIREKVLSWLSPWDHSGRHNAAFDKRAENTGSWFLQSPAFQSWYQKHGSSLWCSGIPGAGKTVLMSSTIEYLRERFNGNKQVGIAFIYFESTGQDQLRHDSVICNIYKQIMSQTMTLPETLIAAWEEDGRVHKRPPNYATVFSLLEYEATQRDIYIVLDALDECGFTDLIRILRALQNLEGKINLLMTSRPLDLAEYALHVRPTITIEADQSDMENYIHRRLQGNSTLADIVAEDPDFGQIVTRQVLEKAQKMFLLLRYHMDSLTSHGTKKGIRKKLSALPAELDEVYDEAMIRIRAQDGYRRELAIEILTWISYAYRPLKLTELIHAIAIEVGEAEFDEENQVSRTGDIVSSCAGLIKINEADQTVQTGHETIREYFQQRRDTMFPSARVQITQKCLSYLLYDDLGNISQTRADLLTKYPFISYAACHWGNYARGEPEKDSNVQSMAFRFLEMEARASDEFTSSRDPVPADKALGLKYLRLRHTSSALHVVSKFGLNSLLTILLARQQSINQIDEHGQTALHWACIDGHKDTVEFLLDCGAEIDARTTWNHMTALTIASSEGFLPIAKLLVERGADINVPCLHGPPGLAALHEACAHGHLEIVKHLLDHGAKIEVEKTQSASGNRVSHTISALFWAMNWDINMFQLLIDRGADTRAPYSFECVQQAVERQQPEFIRALMKVNADIRWAPEGAMPNSVRAIWSGHIPTIEVFHRSVCEDCGTDDTTWAMNALSQQPWFKNVAVQPLDSTTPSMPSSATLDKHRKYKRSDPIQCNQATSRPYIGIVIPEDFSAIQQITVSITSHDQGWSDYRDMHGTYKHSFTWFALFVQFRSETTLSYIEHTIQHNVHASHEPRSHTIILRRDGDDTYLADTISRLRPGDVLQVLARARYPGWVNYVQEMEVELAT